MGRSSNPVLGREDEDEVERQVESTEPRPENPDPTETTELGNKRRRLGTNTDEMEDQLGVQEQPLRSIVSCNQAGKHHANY